MLQLPYRFAIPLMILSGLLHWMASQSIYLVDIDREVAPGVDLQPGFSTTLGYSLLAIVCFMSLGLLMVLALVTTSARRFRTGMPVVGNCSAAISAACHLPESSRRDILKLPLQWGEILVEDTKDAGVGKVRPQRRCGFSSEAVRLPVPGIAYS